MVSLEHVRASEERFADLPDFPWSPSTVDDLPGTEGLRLAYLDEGPADAERVFLCLHGEPTWSFLYRKMIPSFLASGARVVAPDFFGFGRSDKPVDDAVYTWGFHRRSLLELVARLDLRGITLVCQDWGGLLGLTLPLEGPDRYARLLVMNTTLATGEAPPTPGFLAWRSFMASQPDLDVGRLMQRAVPGLGAAEAAAYSAPFPDARAKAGVRRFPAIVPVDPSMEGAAISREAARFWAERWSGQSFMAVGMQDPVLGPDVMAALRKTIRGCPPPLELPSAGHFVQEAGDVVAEAALASFAAG
ncbi:MAG: alpha/beta fold hydrolase [Myxococcales bacterium]|nr:alpha/beta fold hydrolase [Myxococcales bacterium]MCB9714799.1 alpha/beta fold hydrolase [Myxococcales bacterium]